MKQEAQLPHADIARNADDVDFCVNDDIQGHSRSSVVAPIDKALYDFLLALNSNLNSIFKRFIARPYMLWCHIGLSKHKLKPALTCTV